MNKSEYCRNVEEEELIETLWNVNLVVWLFKRQKDFELIETLWNVNYKIHGNL